MLPSKTLNGIAYSLQGNLILQRQRCARNIALFPARKNVSHMIIGEFGEGVSLAVGVPIFEDFILIVIEDGPFEEMSIAHTGAIVTVVTDKIFLGEYLIRMIEFIGIAMN